MISSPALDISPRTRAAAALDLCEKARENVARVFASDPESALLLACSALDRIAILLRKLS